MTSVRVTRHSRARDTCRMSRYRNLYDIDAITIHCSGTPNGAPLSIREIDKWHAKRGFSRAAGARHGWGKWSGQGVHQLDLVAVGYHFFIDHNGRTHAGRRLTETGAHALDPRYPKKHARRYRWNNHGVGICMAGLDTYGRAQWIALEQLVSDLIECDEFGGIDQINGHRDVSPDSNGNGLIDPPEWIKTCPGFSVAEWVAGGMKPLSGHMLLEGSRND